MTECWSEEAKDGSKILYIKKEESVWRLNSAYAPKREAKAWAEQYTMRNIGIPVCLFGLGNGYFLQALLEKAGADATVLVIEPDRDVYEQIKEEYQLETLCKDHRVHLLLGADPKEITDLFYQRINVRTINSLLLCAHPQYEKLYPEEYVAYLKSVHDCQMRLRSVVATEVFHGSRRTENVLEAIALLPENAILQGISPELAEQVPFLIVSAGPSLDQNVEELKVAKGKAVILAVDRAASVLKEHGIVPDLSITLDPVKAAEYSNAITETPFLCSFASNKETMRQHNTHLIFYGGHTYVNQLLQIHNRKVPARDTGGSVATAAFSVCIGLKIKKIILVGQDLAYKDGKTHAAGQRHDREMERYQVEDINGNLIETRTDWYMFLRWFEQTIATYPQIEVIDATEGGAKIKGTKIKKLSEVLEELSEQPEQIEEVIRSMQYQVTEEEYQKILEKMKADVIELQEIGQQAEKGTELAERCIKACRNHSIEKPEYRKQVEKLKQINKKLSSYGIRSFLDYYVGRELPEIMAGIVQMGENEQENQKNTYEQMKRFYEMYWHNSESLKEQMERLWAET